MLTPRSLILLDVQMPSKAIDFIPPWGKIKPFVKPIELQLVTSIPNKCFTKDLLNIILIVFVTSNKIILIAYVISGKIILIIFVIFNI